MARPFLLVQITDPHLGADWGFDDPGAGLRRTVAEVARLPNGADAVVVTGDLADDGASVQYERLSAALEPLGLPVYVLPGNHDRRDAMRAHFGLPGEDADPIQYAVDLGGLRLIALDTTRPGEDAGSLDDDRLSWLEDALAAAPQQPALIAMHHPPMATGIAAWDAIGLPDRDRRALEAVVARHRQVLALCAGHVHQAMTAKIARRPAMTIPSTYVQARPDYDLDRIELVPGPAAFAVHAVNGAGLVSHLRPVP
ncbi:MAG TPA: phosphodiesterase [Solirubrobacteraceae bacterium]|jgi:3',5'-cyclic AMP phosphodiesterase CpdA|nr:phosphodiesterase [Solirubrobacteraceae bacterium]